VADDPELAARLAGHRLLLIGEASHGTREFYAERARLTRQMIEQGGVGAVVVEADWPDAYRVNRYVRGQSDDIDAASALGAFHRFPRWMWRNEVVVEFVEWLREFNRAQSGAARQVGFYGMDLYSLHTSVEAVIAYLDKIDPDGAARARARYSCFDHFGDDPQAYGYATALGGAEPCENEAVGQLVEFQRRAAELSQRDGRVAADEFFFAEQNARLAKNAEAYYRAMFYGRVSSWNLRDRHMAETLDALADHLVGQGAGARLVVWAHNSHLGDARATDMSAAGELNVGQLVRQRHDRDAFLVGFTTYIGSVTAATDWDAPARRRRVRPALPGSYEELFHTTELGNFWISPGSPPLHNAMSEPRLERAIGVIYRPETERFSHYFNARLASQFDAVIHIDETHALTPIDADAGWETEEELAETFPFAV
jgi:erythromycin esterase-like protein